MKITTLIIEDTETKAEMIKKHLHSIGLNNNDIYIAETAVSARKLLRNKIFDLILLDLIIPIRKDSRESYEHGLELLREITEDHTYPEPKFIIGITADATALRECESTFRLLTTQILLVTPENTEWKESLCNIISRLNLPRPETFDYDVCILTALRKPELSHVVDLDIAWGPELAIDGGLLFRVGTRNVSGTDIRVVCTHLPQMGLTPSAFTTRLVIERFRPKIILMTGICGGITNKVKVGDLVVAEKSWDWQSGKWQSNGIFEVSPDQKEGDADLIGIARKSEDRIREIHSSYPNRRPDHIPSFICAPMVSGSSVVADSKLHEKFINQHRKAAAIDMECYGFYYAADMSPPPKPKALCIKSVSDLANRDKDDDFQDYCSFVSARFALEIIDSYFAPHP